MRHSVLSAALLALLLVGAPFCATAGTPTIVRRALQTTSCPSGALDTPTITLASATETTLTFHVCAGASGAPAGFTINLQDALTGEDVANCGASFSGVPPTSTFKLGPNQCIDVVLDASDNGNVGETEGCSLICGTDYLARVFAHQDPASGCNRSPFSAPVPASTQPCGGVLGCFISHGFVRNNCLALWGNTAPESILGTLSGAAKAAQQLCYQLIAVRSSLLITGVSGSDVFEDCSSNTVQQNIDAAQALLSSAGWTCNPTAGQTLAGDATPFQQAQAILACYVENHHCADDFPLDRSSC